MKLSELTESQRKIWRAARRYAASELASAEADESARSTGDSVDRQLALRAEERARRAAYRLMTIIKENAK
jgi:hypothetical protein